MWKCRKSSCQLSIVTPKVWTGFCGTVPCSTKYDFKSFSLRQSRQASAERVVRKSTWLLNWTFGTPLLVRKSTWLLKCPKAKIMSTINFTPTVWTGCRSPVWGSPGWGRPGCGSPLLPTGLTLVHFYPQVWHQSTFIHRSDTSPILPTGLTLVHFYPQVWH